MIIMNESEIFGKKILMVVAQEKFRDEEFLEPRAVFEEHGAEITVASNSTEIAKGALGAEVKPDISIDEVNMDDFDAIVISGGGGSRDYLWDNKELHALITRANDDKKIVAAICISPVVLANAGILNEKNATVFPDQESIHKLKYNGAIYDDVPAIRDGNIVTGRDPASANEFAIRVVEALAEN